jgi:hypothetical protein
MATRKSNTADTERLDDNSIERAIELLENKGTKKDACQILGINYNTTRLGTIIEKYKERKATEAAKRAEKRGKPPTEAEIGYCISSYLEGSPIDTISKSLYRTAAFVRNILDRHNVPIRRTGSSYFSPSLVPEEAIREHYEINERVYSVRYDSLAKIVSERPEGGVYLIWLEAEKWQQFAYQPYYELASLKHLEKYVRIK